MDDLLADSESAPVSEVSDVARNRTWKRTRVLYKYEDEQSGFWHHRDYDRILNGFVVPTLFGLISLVGIIGNALVIYVIVTRARMRTNTNLLLLNVAVGDLVFVVVVPPLTAYQFATSNWPFGDVACRLNHYVVNVIAYVTVYTLVLVAVLRYMTIVRDAETVRCS